MNILMGKSDYVAVSEKYGRRSAIVAEASVTLGNGITLACPIWATIQRDKDTNETSVVIEPGTPKGVTFDDDSKREDFKERILTAAQVWIEYASLEAKAIQRLTAAPKQAVVGKLIRNLTPVKAVTVTAIADAIVAYDTEGEVPSTTQIMQ